MMQGYKDSRKFKREKPQIRKEHVESKQFKKFCPFISTSLTETAPSLNMNKVCDLSSFLNASWFYRNAQEQR